jgi:hypothetical protein
MAPELLEPSEPPQPTLETPLGSTAPGTTAPGTTASDGTAPDGTAPDGTAPDGTAPDGTAPDGTAPDGTASSADASEAPAPADAPVAATVSPKSWRRRVAMVLGPLLLVSFLVVRHIRQEPPRPGPLPSNAWLAAPLRIVDPTTDRAEAVAATLRRSGYGVETYAPEGIDVVGPPGYWWITADAAPQVRIEQVASLLDGGSYVFLDGITDLSTHFLNLQTRNATSRGAKMSGTEVLWERSIAVSVPRTETRVLARTINGFPALVTKGHLLWSLPVLSDSADGPARLPYLPQVLYRTWGMEPRAERRDAELYVDPDAEGNPRPEDLVARWASAGVSRVHVAAWKRNEISGYKYTYKALVKEAHSRHIEVYAWLEWPHVDFTFWETNPKCRERTATDHLAHVGWRQLVALEIPDCFDRAWEATKKVLDSAPFDGVHVSDLMFESPYFGLREPGFLTPFHPWARADFQRQSGVDPAELITPDSKHWWKTDAALTAKWYRWREELLVTIHAKLLNRLQKTKAGRNIMVDLLDDRLDPAIGPIVRENSGVSTERILALRAKTPFKIVVKDPYPFRKLDAIRAVATYRRGRQLPSYGVDVVPEIGLRNRSTTETPTGVYLYGVLGETALATDTTAVQSPRKLPRTDLDWLRFALAGSVVDLTEDGADVLTTSPRAFLLRLQNPAQEIRIDGKVIPLTMQVPVPSGTHRVTLK